MKTCIKCGEIILPKRGCECGKRKPPVAGSATGYAAIREIRQAIHQTRDDHADVIAAMPTRATTAGQRALQKKHGTPRAFARAVVNSIGEISILEAQLAIRKYRDEWQAA